MSSRNRAAMQPSGSAQETDADANPPLTIVFRVGGMSCTSCAERLTQALLLVPGVAAAEVDFLSQRAEVAVCPERNGTVAAAVVACVGRLGYALLRDDPPAGSPSARGNRMQDEGARVGDASLLSLLSTTSPAPADGTSARKTDGAGDLLSDAEAEEADAVADAAESTTLTRTRLLVEGMSCSSCAARVEAALAKLPGVREASVNFALMGGSVVHDAQRTSVATLLKVAGDLGYDVSLQSTMPIAAPLRRQSACGSCGRPECTCGDSCQCSTSRELGDCGCMMATAVTPPSLSANRRQRRLHLQSGGGAAGSASRAPRQTHSRASGPPLDSPPNAARRLRFLVDGMSCASCAARIESALRALPFVTDCTVVFATCTASVMVDARLGPAGSDAACDDAVLRAITSLGYTATPLTGGRRERATGSGTYQSTQSRQLRAKKRTSAAGDDSGHLNDSDNDGDVATTAVEVEAEAGGERAVPPSETDRTREVLERKQEILQQRRYFEYSAVLCVPLVAAMLLMAFTDLMESNRRVALAVDAAQMLCATPIVCYFGRQFFVRAWRSYVHGAYTMDTLVAIGTGCSYIYSVAAFFISLVSHVHLMTYFDTAGMLTTFMLLGRFLEARAKRNTSGALITLMSLAPSMATLIADDGTDVRVASAELCVGDRVRVLAGDRIPADGVVREGCSDVDGQLVTGESVPKPCEPGTQVVGGTLNVTASIVVEVEKVGDDTVLSQILRIVQEAQNTKPAVQRVADRMAMYFVPFVVLSSMLTLVVWVMLGMLDAYPSSWRPHGVPWQTFAINFFIATVVAACPCALGLATPTAIMVGTGVGAQHGILVKSGVTLECVRRTTCVLFDKTGTITRGELRVHGLACFGRADGAETALAKRLVAAVEAQSTHPIARAVAAGLQPPCEVSNGGDVATKPTDAAATAAVSPKPLISVLAVITHPGKGLEAVVAAADSAAATPEEYAVLAGNLALMEQHGVAVPDEVAAAVREHNNHGYTTVVGAVNGTACIVVALADEAKPEAAGVLAELQRQGVRTMMVTGDSALVAATVADEVGIAPEDVRAETLPSTKAEVVKSLQADGLCVMFVGDGINDSPALAQADVGVALGAGTEVAIEAADAVLMRSSLVDLLTLRALSNTTVRRIYGNFVWAFGYNLVMLPLASGALYPLLRVQLPPVVAGAAMVLSSLSVLLSSLSIRCFSPCRTEDYVQH